ncbi:sensor histidine kinase [Pimelobacter simplex]|uniref:histidine kinase n=1 Tax=Nocardioides simplex TaxID=2045 RepID=A0A0A1DTM7_NOCSI|nr:histidine kinase [Pimelobacter simplex]AIY18765.1 putative two-component system sensor kinase [Pimelobacter simplex]MCG8152340.1 sensor histidine kinase [Pimelobacter simplex]GEB14455.1 histidine kinase [Pimelobacter simplex]SFM29472.1 Signal transduction histidine kinase [Pimelobacter simplex]
MTDWPAMDATVTVDGLVERLRLTLLSAGYAVSFVPSLALAILTLLCIPLGLAGVGFVLALAVVPMTAALTAAHRQVSGRVLGETIPARYAPTGSFALAWPVRWVRDPARWRDFGFLCFSATGGFVMSLVPVALLTTPVTWLILAFSAGEWVWLLLLLLSGPMLLAWWFVTEPLVTARARSERAILGHDRVAELAERVERVEESRAETLDHNAAEVRRIERDLHDGAQARIASVGMSVGLAEKLLHSDPEAAAALLREARETTIDALDDLRSVVRGIHPPVLADRGLAGAIEALAVALPLPVAVAVDVPRLPAPVESAAYFAVAECLANTVKHAAAGRSWVSGSYDGDTLRLLVGDDGRGGADPAGSGLSGVARRLDAFDGTLSVDSPEGGPTTVRMEVPCRTP